MPYHNTQAPILWEETEAKTSLAPCGGRNTRVKQEPLSQVGYVSNHTQLLLASFWSLLCWRRLFEWFAMYDSPSQHITELTSRHVFGARRPWFKGSFCLLQDVALSSLNTILSGPVLRSQYNSREKAQRSRTGKGISAGRPSFTHTHAQPLAERERVMSAWKHVCTCSFVVSNLLFHCFFISLFAVGCPVCFFLN